MRYGLLLPCRLANVFDCTHYAVQLPGQSEVEVILAGCDDVLTGIHLSKAIVHLAEYLDKKKLVLWLPQPVNDTGFYRSIREGGAYLGDILADGDSVASYAIREGLAMKCKGEGDWNGDEWVGRWNL